MFIDMLNLPNFSTFDLSTLYTGIMGGSPCPIETMRQVIETMNMEEITVRINYVEMYQDLINIYGRFNYRIRCSVVIKTRQRSIHFLSWIRHDFTQDLTQDIN